MIIYHFKNRKGPRCSNKTVSMTTKQKSNTNKDLRLKGSERKPKDVDFRSGLFCQREQKEAVLTSHSASVSPGSTVL